MSHYFETPSGRVEYVNVNARIWGKDYRLTSANGIFSAHRLDLGTSVLFKHSSPPPDKPLRLLDLGCGFGPIAIALASECRQAVVDAVDVNQLAVELTNQNAADLGLSERVHAVLPEMVDPNIYYDEIWSNPPIRIGKTELHEMLTSWLTRLVPGGIAWLVVGKNLGGDSLHKWVEDQGFTTTRAGSSKGFRVLKVENGNIS